MSKEDVVCREIFTN